MFTKFQKSLQTGIVTSKYPKEKEPAPLRFRGRIEIDNERCKQCNMCVDVCPTNAYTWIEEKGKRYLQLSHAKCVFCGMCEEACPYKAIRITNDFELAATNKEDLLVKAGLDTKASVEELGEKLKEKIFSVFKRSLHVREVDAGSCNGCEWEVIALGACACSGGIFSNCYATKNGIDNVVPVDAYIPGCPPRPQAIIYGFLLALERIDK